MKNAFDISLHSDGYDFFQTWYDDRNDQTLQFDISLHDFVLHPRSEGYKEPITCATILPPNCVKKS